MDIIKKSSTKKNSNFLLQGSILAIASMICRIIGLFYRIPMTNIIGDLGNGYYSCAFDIYNIMLIISSYSLPLAVSKLISSENGKNNKRQVYQILKGAIIFALISGTLVALIVWFGAKFFTTTLLKTPYSIYALKVLTPALVVVALLGVIRGFFQGLNNMTYSAISQVIEQIVNAIVSVSGAYILFQYGKKIGDVVGHADEYSAAYGAAGGTLGTSLGSLAGLIFMIVVFTIFIKKFRKEIKNDVDTQTFSYTIKILIMTIIPVLLSTTIYNMSGIIDQGLFKNLAVLQNYSATDIDISWGVFTGKYKLLTTVIISIASSIAASAVPSLTISFEKKEMGEVQKKINIAIRFIMIIAFPCMVGLTVLAKPFILVLFPNTASTIDLSTTMMLLGSSAVVFYSLSTLTNGLLQGINKLKTPVINAVISLILHDTLLIILMLCCNLGIYAVVISHCVFALLMCVLNGIALKKYSGYKQEYKKTFIIPFISAFIMGIITYITYSLLSMIIPMLVSCIITVFVSMVTYGILIIKLKGISQTELKMMPKGTLLIKFCKKLKLM